MKIKCILIIVFFIAAKIYTQNPSYYKVISGFTDLKMYKQINISPYVFKDGDLLNENIKPNWYEGLMFNNNPGGFDSTSELYTYLSDDVRFNESPAKSGSYYNKENLTSQEALYGAAKAKLNQSKNFSNDEDFLGSIPSETSKFRRYTSVYQELYISYKDEEFLILTTSNIMFDNHNTIPTETMRQKKIDFLKGSTQDFTNYKEAGLRISILFKESGTWKWVASTPRIYAYFNTENLNTPLANIFQQSLTTIDVESSIDTSGIRTFIEN